MLKISNTDTDNIHKQAIYYPNDKKSEVYTIYKS